MFWRTRSFWLASIATAYVSFAALNAGGIHAVAWVCPIGLPIVLALAWRSTAPPRRGEDAVNDDARSASRATIAGAAILLAARSGPDRAGFVALANIGVAIASMSSLIAQ